MVDVESNNCRVNHFKSNPNATTHATTQVDNDKIRPMKQEANRLQSFIYWSTPYIEPRDLTQQGFFYTQKSDIVKCAFCGLELGKWENGDVPATDHRNWSPLCPIVRKAPCGNVPLPMSDDSNSSNTNGVNGISDAGTYDTCGKYGIVIRPNSVPENSSKIYQYTIDNNYAYPHLATYDARLKTFSDWPKSIKQKPAELAEAGFYYSGKSDQTICFACGGGLKAWEDEDIPWEQHASWFSKCPYLRLHKTPEFIEANRYDAAESLKKDVPNASTSSPEPKPKNVECLNSTATATKSSEPLEVAAGESTSTAVSAMSETTKDSQTLCKICYTKEVGVVFLPCGHMIACVDCAPALTRCGVCRRELEATVRAFLA